jgi:hypothetical protein
MRAVPAGPVWSGRRCMLHVPLAVDEGAQALGLAIAPIRLACLDRQGEALLAFFACRDETQDAALLAYARTIVVLSRTASGLSYGYGTWAVTG